MWQQKKVKLGKENDDNDKGKGYCKSWMRNESETVIVCSSNYKVNIQKEIVNNQLGIYQVVAPHDS